VTIDPEPIRPFVLQFRLSQGREALAVEVLIIGSLPTGSSRVALQGKSRPSDRKFAPLSSRISNLLLRRPSWIW